MYIKISKKILLDSTPHSKIYKYNNQIIKTIKKNIITNYKNEYNILSKLNNKNIIKINKIEETDKYFNMYMNYYPCGDLHFNISENKLFNTKNIDKLIYYICSPIYYIHSNNIIHLDIKPENFLVNHNNNSDLTLIDFYGSKIDNDNDYYNLKKNYYLTYTKTYAAPEIFDNYYCKSSDIYSIGIILYAFFTHSFPNNFTLDKKLLNSRCEPNISNFICDLLENDCKYRPSIYDIMYYINK